MLRFIALFVGVAISATAAVYSIVATPMVYWHVASDGLPSDVQALALALAGPSPTLYAGTWGSGVYRIAGSLSH